MPDLYDAYRIFVDRRQITRHGIEARTLAGTGIDIIAHKRALRAGTVAAYQQYFFDVAGRLDQPGYILHHVIGPRIFRPGPWSYDLLWKYFGYIGGPCVLDELMRAAGPDRPAHPSDVAQYLAAHSRNELLRYFAAASSVWTLDQRVRLSLIHAEVEQYAKEPYDQQENIKRSIVEIIQSFGFRTARRGDGPELRILPNGWGAEPRASELLQDALNRLQADVQKETTDPESPVED
jgi:hypothetical protein